MNKNSGSKEIQVYTQYNYSLMPGYHHSVKQIFKEEIIGKYVLTRNLLGSSIFYRFLIDI